MGEGYAVAKAHTSNSGPHTYRTCALALKLNPWPLFVSFFLENMLGWLAIWLCDRAFAYICEDISIHGIIKREGSKEKKGSILGFFLL